MLWFLHNASGLQENQGDQSVRLPSTGTEFKERGTIVQPIKIMNSSNNVNAMQCNVMKCNVM